MLFAKAYDYEVIFTRERNAYGAYLDFFEPKQPDHCRITEDMYQVDDRVQLQEITEETQRTRKNPMTPRDAPHIRSSSDECVRERPLAPLDRADAYSVARTR